MSEIRDAGWLNTLTEVEGAIAGCLTALDRYEAAFGGLLADSARSCAVPTVPAEPDDEWTARLAVAARHADGVERLLAEQEAAWSGWLTRFTAWQRSLEQRG